MCPNRIGSLIEPQTFSGRNTLAYFVAVLVTKEKSFYNIYTRSDTEELKEAKVELARTNSANEALKQEVAQFATTQVSQYRAVFLCHRDAPVEKASVISP